LAIIGLLRCADLEDQIESEEGDRAGGPRSRPAPRDGDRGGRDDARRRSSGGGGGDDEGEEGGGGRGGRRGGRGGDGDGANLDEPGESDLEYDEMGDFIVDEGPGAGARARRRRQALSDAIPGISAAALEVCRTYYVLLLS
jgi:hypothetical protein